MATEDFDLQLISRVEKHPCLYDRGDLYYGDDRSIQAAWNVIATNLQTTECVVKARWKDLKKSFGKAYRDFSSSAPSCTGHPKSCIAFPFFEGMLWLAPYIHRKSNHSASLKIRKCPVHSVLDNQISQRIENSVGQKNCGTGISNGSESTHSSSSYFTESTHNIDKCRHTSICDENTKPQNGNNNKNLNEREKHYNNSKASVTDKMNNNNNNKHAMNKCEESNAASQHTQSETETYEPGITKEENKFNFIHNYYEAILNPDMSFMMSVLFDMQLISRKNKIKFKRELLQLVEKYALNEE